MCGLLQQNDDGLGSSGAVFFVFVSDWSMRLFPSEGPDFFIRRSSTSTFMENIDL